MAKIAHAIEYYYIKGTYTVYIGTSVFFYPDMAATVGFNIRAFPSTLQLNQTLNTAGYYVYKHFYNLATSSINKTYIAQHKAVKRRSRFS